MATRLISNSRFIVSNGVSSVNFVQNGDLISIPSTAIGSSYTVCFWLNQRSLGGGNAGRILDRGADIIFIGSPSQITVNHNSNGTSSGNNYVLFNKWVHYALVWSGTSIKFYRNGILFSTIAQTSALANSGNTFIGNRVDGIRYLDGKLKDFRRYNNQQLTQSEIYDIYLEKGDSAAVKQLEYKLNEGSGTTAIDSSGNGNNGTITGAVYSTDIPGHMTPRSSASNRFLIATSTQKSLSFNGTSSKAVIPIVPSTNGISLGFWFQRLRTGTAERYVMCSTSGNSSGFGFGSDASNFYCFIYNGTTQVYLTNPLPIIGKWMHIVMTWIPGTNNAKIYINGVFYSQTTCAAMTVSQNFTLGSAANNALYSKCLIKNFTFHNTTTPWTATQVPDLCFRNIIPSGATQHSMNDVATDQNGENGLTLTGTSYSTNVPGHMSPRTAV